MLKSSEGVAVCSVGFRIADNLELIAALSQFSSAVGSSDPVETLSFERKQES